MYRWLRTMLTPTRIARAYFDGDAGGGGAGSGTGAGTGTGSSSGGSGSSGSGGSGTAASASGSTAPVAGDAPKTEDSDAPGAVPYTRFKEVNDRLRELERVERERTEADLKAKGEHETLAAKARAERDAAVSAMQRAVRASTFAQAAAGKVADVKAAATLALADGMLDGLKVDADGNVEGDAGKIVTDLLKAYPMLEPKTGPKPTGQPLGGAGANPVDPSKLSSDEKIRIGIEQAMGSLPEHRRGLVRSGSSPNG